MIVRFAGGSLAGRVLWTSWTAWPGGWLRPEGGDWSLYRPVHRDQASGIVLAEVQETEAVGAGRRGPVDG